MKLFISHATRDNPVAERICGYLSAAGIRCWLDNFEVDPEADWLKEVAAAVRESSHGLFLLSPAAVRSPSSMKEYRSMLALDKPMYVALVEPVDSDDLPVDLKTAHTFDLVRDFEGGLERLKQAMLENEGAVRLPEPDDDARDITITLQANLTDLDTDKFVDLVARLVDAGITDIKVGNVTPG